MGRNDEVLTRRNIVAGTCACILSRRATAADRTQDAFAGRWAIQATNGHIFWLEVKPGQRLEGTFFGATGGRLARLLEARVKDGELHFAVERVFDSSRTVRAVTTARRNGSGLRGRTAMDGRAFDWTGWRSPEIADRDDGSWKDGAPFVVNGFSQLRPIRSGGEKEWTFADGVLRNLSPKAPLLLTTERFWNFVLRLEYKLPANGNSGIGLRSHYELQLADDYGAPPDVHGNVSLYSRVPPTVNASKPPGEWQQLTVRFVGRELTVDLNGTRVIDRTVVEGLCGLALDPREERPGPVALQGDHGAVEFRNISITPLVRS
ncbi:MAG TPA: DUF1080 domain-containing protein [Bryobacteraceae bacterium]|nr:DUF1080 domain-containing protein [Bryobacteraceae bacterium]